MKFSRISLVWLLGILTVCVPGFSASGDTGNPMQDASRPRNERLDRAWKRYRNASLGYCVSYPSRWVKDDAFDGSGFLVKSGVGRRSRAVGEIDIGPVNTPGPEDARLEPASFTENTLDENFKEHVAGLQKFVRAEKLEVIAQHQLKLQGLDALYVKDQYYDPLERHSWMEEVVFVGTKGELYRLELQCPPDQIGRFEPVFAYLVNSFEFACR